MITLYERMTLQGYKSYPVTNSQSEAEKIDRAFVETQYSECSKCGERMIYEGWFSESSYRSFAVCIQCDNREEF